MPRVGAEVSPFAAWEKTLTPAASNPFATVDPFRATYRFGWEGIGAGGAEVEVTEGYDSSGTPNPLRRRITGKGGPNSLIRKLWNYQAEYVGEAGADGQLPAWFHMDETVAKGDYLSDAFFDAEGGGTFLACHRFPWEKKPWTLARLPGVRDLFAAMLLIAALNRFILMPRLAMPLAGQPQLDAVRLLERNSLIEIALALLIFAAVGLLGMLHPAIHGL